MKPHDEGILSLISRYEEIRSLCLSRGWDSQASIITEEISKLEREFFRRSKVLRTCGHPHSEDVARVLGGLL